MSTFHLIPHTHWDREWYLARPAFQARLAAMMDGMLAQLERDPEARFLLDGQTILCEDYLAMVPGDEERIARQVRRGALDIGPWYVLSDLLIPSAASLRRNLAEGRRDAGRFGPPLDVLYSPDAFGHPANLPSLAAEFGITRAVIRRGLGLPLDCYRWEDDRGGSLLVHHLPRGGYDYAVDLATREGAALAAGWEALRAELLGRAVTPEIAVFVGADHHAMVDGIVAFRDRLRAADPEHAFRVSSLREYFDAVEATRPDPPRLRGELRRGGGHTWVLQDVLSARSRIKRRHAAAERRLTGHAEPLDALAGGTMAGPLRLAWRTLLRSQFHDTLAGTTSDEAQREQLVRLDAVEAIATEVTRTSFHALLGHDPDRARAVPSATMPLLALWNPLVTRRTGVHTATLTFFRRDILVGPPTGRVPATGEGYRPFALRAGSGETIPVQLLAVEAGQERTDAPRHYPDQDEVDVAVVAFRATLEAGALARFTLADGGAVPAGDVTVAPGRLANDLIEVTVPEAGTITLLDRATGIRHAELGRFVAQHETGDLYTFSGLGTEAPLRAVPRHQRIVAAGPLLGAIETVWTIAHDDQPVGVVTQRVEIRAGERDVRMTYGIDSHAVDLRLRLALPVGAGRAVAGTTSGTVEHPPAAETGSDPIIERAAGTAPAHGFVACGNATAALLVSAPGCWEYQWCEGVLLLTLLRATGELAREGLPERPGRAAWPIATPDAQETGRHDLSLTLTPLPAGALDDGVRLTSLAEAANTPALPCWIRNFSGGR